MSHVPKWVQLTCNVTITFSGSLNIMSCSSTDGISLYPFECYSVQNLQLKFIFQDIQGIEH